jgi:ABC-type sugar transport system permease subunit
MGYAAAIAFVLFVVVLGLTAIQFRIQKRRDA